MDFNVLLPVLAGLAAGIGWSTIGVWQRWRENQDASVDWKRLRKNLVVGTGLGIITWGYAIFTGDATPTIATVKDFVLAVGGYFPLVVIVDKLLAKHSE